MVRTSLLLGAALLLHAPDALAQSLTAIDRERADFAAWLATAPLSPFAAIAVQPVGPGISLGDEPADIPLGGFGKAQVIEQGGSLVLVRDGKRQPLPRGRAVPVSGHQLIAEGDAGRRVLVVFGPVKGARAPAWYPVDASRRVTVKLTAPSRRGAFRTLGLDGVETRAEEAGFAAVTLGGVTTQLRVYRMGAAEDEEAELMIFFRDSTNSTDTYPAGRFVSLDPAGGGSYIIDFNKARNPFCAYSTVFPCPAPWPGNTLPLALRAGEKYVKP